MVYCIVCKFCFSVKFERFTKGRNNSEKDDPRDLERKSRSPGSAAKREIYTISTAEKVATEKIENAIFRRRSDLTLKRRSKRRDPENHDRRQVKCSRASAQHVAACTKGCCCSSKKIVRSAPSMPVMVLNS
jgi:hypothetical protein